MPLVEINPMNIDGANIRYYKPLESIKDNQECIVFSESKATYFGIRIDKIIIDANVTEIPILEINNNIVGPLAYKDKARIYQWNMAIAEKIEIALAEEDHRDIVKGDWTNTLREILMDQIFYEGAKIKAVLSIEDLKLSLNGIILNTIPLTTPVKVGENTKIFITKLPATELDEIKREIEVANEYKIEELRDLIKKELLKKITLAKTKLQMANETIDFTSSNPRIIEDTIAQIFIGYEMVNKKVLEEENTFSSSGTYVAEKLNNISQIIEYSISFTNEHGSIVLQVYDLDKIKATQYARNLWSIIKNISKGFKEEAEGFISNCPYCGGDLDLTKIDDEGYVKCPYCRTKLKVEKKW